MISVVVTALEASDSIAACLRAVLSSPSDDPVEVIVVASSADGTAQIVEEQFPGVALVRSGEEELFPGDARNLGFASSRGEILAFLDAHCVPDRDWLREIARAHRAATPAVGGVIANGDPRYGRWPSYLCKLTKWMPRRSPSHVDDLPSECLSVKRSALNDLGPFLERTYSSATAFGWKLTERGQAPLLDPSIRVSRINAPSLSTFVRNEPRHGRYFARVRVREQGLGTSRRLAFAFLSPLLPFVLFARAGARVLRHRTYVAEFLLAAPLVFLGHAAWALGELLGYLSPPGEVRTERAGLTTG